MKFLLSSAAPGCCRTNLGTSCVASEPLPSESKLRRWLLGRIHLGRDDEGESLAPSSLCACVVSSSLLPYLQCSWHKVCSCSRLGIRVAACGRPGIQCRRHQTFENIGPLH